MKWYIPYETLFSIYARILVASYIHFFLSEDEIGAYRVHTIYRNIPFCTYVQGS